jgi:sigma-B regulation protein RsbU (phosphoserine phosphatase)
MRPVDLSLNPKIAVYVDLLRRVSRHTDPIDVQREFANLLREDRMFDGMISLSVRGLPAGKYKITRLNLEDDVGTLTINPWQQWDTLATHSGGFIGRVIETQEPKILQHMSIRGDPVLGDRLARFGSCFVNPLYDDGQALNWSITFRLSPEGYAADDVVTGMLRGNIIGRMTKTLVVAKQVRELNTKLTAQLEEIAQIQRSLLPDRLPDVPGLSLATSYLTSNESGGDYYDFFDMGQNRLGVIVADVSGHGAGAATVMAMLQTILHSFQERDRGPAAMLEHANRELLRKRIEPSFVTAFAGVIDRERNLMTYSNAGHNRPERRSADGTSSPLEGGASVPLSILDKPDYTDATTPLAQGETLVLYTDGITEAFSPPPNREMFGAARIRTALANCTGAPDCVIDHIHQKLFEHTRSRDRADDQTLVAVRVEEN